MTRQGHYQKKAQLANGREPLECKAGNDEAEERYFQSTQAPCYAGPVGVVLWSRCMDCRGQEPICQRDMIDVLGVEVEPSARPQ
jgi:hypothetical protein